MANLLDTENAIDIVRGTSRTLALTVTDAAGVPVNLTGARVVFTVKCSVQETDNKIQKDSARDAADASVTAASSGQAQIYLQPQDTQGMEPGKYVFDVWVLLSGGARYLVVGPGPFNVRAGVTVL